MLAKRTVKNQITLPKAVVKSFADVDYFQVATDGEVITLRPLRPSRAHEVRLQLEALGLGEQDVEDAVAWSRSRP